MPVSSRLTLHGRRRGKRRDDGRVRTTAAILAVLGLGFLGTFAYRELRGGDAKPEGVPVLSYPVDSQLLGRRVGALAVVPPPARGRPLLVLLHDRGRDARSLLTPELLKGLVRLGDAAPVVLVPEGPSRFRDGPGGRWGSFVLVEAIPDAVERFDLGDRAAIGGAGSGGADALALARLARGRFCAAGAETVALLRPFGDLSGACRRE